MRRISDWKRISLGVAVSLAIALGVGMRSAAIGQEPGAAPTPSRRIEIREPLMITVTAVPPYGAAPLLTGFFVNSVDLSEPLVSYIWNFGDGHVSTLAPPMAYNTYRKPGTYVVTVTVVSASGRQATGFASVIVKPATTG